MPLNTTGLANTDHYLLGRGKVYAAVLDTTTGLPDDDGFRFLGNAPAFSVSQENETLEHTSSQEGLRVVDTELIVSQKSQMSLTLDEINNDNLALVYTGATATTTNPGATAKTNVEQPGLIKLGRWYDLYDGSGGRVMGLSAAGTFSIEESNDGFGTNTPLTEDTDYEVDYEFGRVFFLTTGNATAGYEFRFSNVLAGGGEEADSIYEVRGLSQSSSVLVLKFIQENAKTGKKGEYTFHKVTLRPEGEISLIGDEFTTAQFTGTIEKNEQASTASPYFTYREVSAT